MAPKKSKLLGSLEEKDELVDVPIGTEHKVPNFLGNRVIKGKKRETYICHQKRDMHVLNEN
jgi:hypothetical protein